MDITLVCFRGGPFAREAAELGIETRVCSGGFFSALREVRRMIAEEGFELVHTHGSRANLAGAILRSTCGRPVVSTIHSDYRLDYMGRPLAAATYGVLNVLALRRIKYHVGVSDAMRDLLISRRFRGRRPSPSTTAWTSPGSRRGTTGPPSARAWERMWPRAISSSARPRGSTP